SLTKSLATEWGAEGVRVNALCPGWTATDLNRNLWEDPAAGPATIASVPMQRWGRAEEMAGPAVFLASGGASYLAGPVRIVEGGQTISRYPGLKREGARPAGARAVVVWREAFLLPPFLVVGLAGLGAGRLLGGPAVACLRLCIRSARSGVLAG